jgi:hypothetical protein
MKFVVKLWGLYLVAAAVSCSPFAVVVVVGAFTMQPKNTLDSRMMLSSPAASALYMGSSIELKAEPDGGVELAALSATLPGARVKQMDQLKNVKRDMGTPYQFWMTATVEGELIKSVRTQILKDASKKANFPGFRKVSSMCIFLVYFCQLSSFLHSVSPYFVSLSLSPTTIYFNHTIGTSPTVCYATNYAILTTGSHYQDSASRGGCIWVERTRG